MSAMIRLGVLFATVKESVNFGVIPALSDAHDAIDENGFSRNGQTVDVGAESRPCPCFDLPYCKLGNRESSGDENSPKDLRHYPPGKWHSSIRWCYHTCFRSSEHMNQNYVGDWVNPGIDQGLDDAQHFAGCKTALPGWLYDACSPAGPYQLEKYTDKDRDPALPLVTQFYDHFPQTVFEESNAKITRSNDIDNPWVQPLCYFASISVLCLGTADGSMRARNGCADPSLSVSDCFRFFELQTDYAAGTVKRAYCKAVKVTGNKMECRAGESEPVSCGADGEPEADPECDTAGQCCRCKHHGAKSRTQFRESKNCRQELKKNGEVNEDSCNSLYKSFDLGDVNMAAPCRWNARKSKCETLWNRATTINVLNELEIECDC